MAKFLSSSSEAKEWDEEDDDASLSLDSLMDQSSPEEGQRGRPLTFAKHATTAGTTTSSSSTQQQQLYPSASNNSLNEQHAPPQPPLVPTNLLAAAASGQLLHTTIDQLRRNSSDGHSSYDNLQIAPAHPFFSASFYEDSDGSDGSIIFSYQPGTPTHDPRTATTLAHDRFPSFDSTASNGSFRFVGHGSGAASTTGVPQQLQQQHAPQQQHPPQQQQPQQHQQQQQHVQSNVNLSRINPQYLPYHERRKLLIQQQLLQQQQQQQQQQHHQQQQQQQSTQQQQHRQQPLRPSGRSLPFVPADARHSHAPASNMFPHAYPSPESTVQPNGFPQILPPNYPFSSAAAGVGWGMHSPPTQQQYAAPLPSTGSNYRPRPPVRISDSKPLSSAVDKAATANVRGKQPTAQFQQQQQPPQPPLQHPSTLLPHHSLPPSGSQRWGRSRASSHDSTSPERDAYMASSSAAQHGRMLRQKSAPSDFGPPPPPPTAAPPPPHNARQQQQQKQQQKRRRRQHHVRTESSGSISSLESSNSNRDDDGDVVRHHDHRPHRHRRSSMDEVTGASTFLQLFNPWSPKKVPPLEPTTHDVSHRPTLLRPSERSTPTMKMVMNNSPLRQQQQRRGGDPTDRPPATRGSHKRLPSIENDNWDEEANVSSEQTPSTPGSHTYFTSDGKARTIVSVARPPRHGEASSSSPYSSDATDDDAEYFREPADERTSLLPPSGISTHERGDWKQSYTDNRKPPESRSEEKEDSWAASKLSSIRSKDNTVRVDNRKVEELFGGGKDKKHQKKNRNRSRRARFLEHDDSEEEDSSSPSHDYRRWTKKRARLREKERTRLIEQWKAEARAEAEASRRKNDSNRWYRRCCQTMSEELATMTDRFFKFAATTERFISNLPLTIGAIAMAIALLGVVWFKFVEENLDSCQPVHFHSSQCTFPEFPGCFYCDKSSRMYIAALRFHYTCSTIAGVLALSFIAKVLLATRVVLDEMSSPTTSSPAGLLCMTTVCVFAGKGFLGQLLVSAATAIHLCIVIWFIYMALAYHIMPEPSWFPNTVGIGLSAVKTWLYYPMTGQVLMAMSLTFMFFFFPISLIRVTLNEKISAPVGWMQMSAPAIALYSLTIMAQPTFKEEHPDITSFQRVHRIIYLPCMHFLFVLSVIGFLSSVQSLCVRWNDFRKKPFSPAHAAFCFPTLSHANSIQAYRAAVNSFSDIPNGSPLKVALYVYWVIVLIGGSAATCWITAKFLYCLPSWTHIDVADEEEPPAPFETSMTLNNIITTGETLRQPFVSPAVLQANETGALVMVTRPDRRQTFVRTRRLPALGFEPTMEWSEMEREREVLLEWVVKNPPRRRHRTLSVPGIDLSYGSDELGSGNVGIYGLEDGQNRWRSNSSASPYITAKRFQF